MMGALAAGGVPIVSDGRRAPDEHNPRGYYEDRRVLWLAQQSDWLSEHRGEAVKILSHLLPAIPGSIQAKILFMRRPLRQIEASQRRMLGDEVEGGPAWTSLLGRDLAHTLDWLETQTHLTVLQVSYLDLLRSPKAEFQKVVEFLDLPLHLNAMVETVDPSLHRHTD